MGKYIFHQYKFSENLNHKKDLKKTNCSLAENMPQIVEGKRHLI